MERNNYNDLVDIRPNTKITIEFEKEFWKNYILEKLIQKPDNCLLCNYTSLNIIENNTINNPFAGKLYI